MIEVLIVDDSPTVRQVLLALLESDPAIRVIGVATTGTEAIQQTVLLHPDLILMDIRMPGMDGFEATKRIMEECPTPIVIVSSLVNEPDMNVTFNAIRAGALDVVEKPVGFTHEDYQTIRQRLISAVRLMAEVKVIRQRRRAGQTALLPTTALPRREWSVVAMAASTGGPAALNKILCSLPATFPLPILVVQHITPGFLEGLVNWLQVECPLPIQVVRATQVIKAGHVYFAPDGSHMEVQRGGLLVLNESARVSHVRPSGTVLFQSVARVYGNAAIGVLLTGMGDDGALGLQQIHKAGGMALVQDAASSVINGMPGAAVALGAATRVLPLDRIAPTLAQLTQSASPHPTL